jgi:hypothetical protein
MLIYVGGLPWELYLHGNIRISQQVFISTSSLVFIFENIIVESVNGLSLSDKTVDEVNQLLRECRHRCDLEVEFDVTG